MLLKCFVLHFLLLFRRNNLILHPKNYFIAYMNKKILIPLIVVILVLVGAAAWLFINLQEQKQAVQDMEELAELDKQEMENEYERFTMQYSEMKTQINNDSIIAQLTAEQMRTQKLLEELKQVKASDAREIARLKKELATVRAVLRDYVYQIDSLNRLNQNLMDENDRVRSELAESNQQNQQLESQRATLSEKVAIASQLDATNIRLTPLKKSGKAAKHMKDAKTIDVSFVITKNVTATNGSRNVYVRVTTPEGEVLNGGGTFEYSGKQLAWSMKKAIEYTGEETALTLYWTVNEYLGGGQYNVSIFCDGQAIGSRNFNFDK
jgi:myosin heavy subunit